MTRRAGHAAGGAAVAVLTVGAAGAQVSQTPLFLGGGNVPGNLALVPSVEFPTINSVANLGPYDESRDYLGYFDPRKCYLYQYSSVEAERHFYPVRFTPDRRCTGSGEWSGNFMNWAATQTVDPFRWVLTGGYRVTDTPTETWLEKARQDGQMGTTLFPNRRLPAAGNDASMVQGATPFQASWMRMRIQGLGNQMQFRLNSNDVDANVADYDPSAALESRAYRVSVRVAVCVPGLLEGNCRQYSQGYKPEGLIQQYARELRVSVFGYLNDSDPLRDGGVLRARQNFVGPTMIVPGEGTAANPGVEWNAATGVLLQNPAAGDASATSSAFNVSISNSGAINYVNRFGQLTSNNHKSFDPVSELYYAALRYFKAQGNVPEYTSVTGDQGARAQLVDGFPVITDWDDPVQYACQKNAILGIGDVYTHRDKNLPGSPYGNDEPSTPQAVASDDTVNVVTWTNRVGQSEGLGNIGSTSSWSGRSNSAYIAGLAYHANTSDLRPDLPGTQTISTYWVDVHENQTLEPPAANQYYLAAKYGGFRVPEEFDPDTFAGTLPLEWWHTNGDTLMSTAGGVSFPRPDNYYSAGEADAMVESLTEAFARIAAELRSSASSVAANSTRVDAGTAVFQAAFDSTHWSGELQAFRVGADGAIAEQSEWNAADRLDVLTPLEIANRRIFTVTPPSPGGEGQELATNGIELRWAELAPGQREALRQTSSGTLVSEAVAQQRLAYLRGAREQEQPNGPFRQRDSRLGDIVNSDPQFIHRQDFGYGLLEQSAAFGGTGVGSAYRTFRESAAYENRPAMVVVGANDGMLHVFNAELDGNGGEELLAFVPHSVFDNLYELTEQSYSHRYYVDGTPRVADAWLGDGPGWRTIAVGATGAGGRSVFALDITDPVNATGTNVLWEFSHPQMMGFTLGQAAVTPLPNGQFGVVVTSGYENGQSDGRIWILNPANGSIIHTIDVPTAGGELGAPLLVDLNGDRVADRIYVADTRGNLWRFDLDGAVPGNWRAPNGLRQGGTALPLFVARDASGARQAITAPLTSAFTDQGEHAIFFGTGSFYQVDDNVVPDNPPVDTFYGIIDRGVQIAGRAELLEQEIVAEQIAQGARVRGVTNDAMQPGQSGWFLDLVWKPTYGGPGPIGERVVSRALVRGDRVIFATLVPNPDPCSFGGDGWIMELDAFTGGRLSYAVFDLNADGQFDADDWITVTIDGESVQIPVSGIAPGVGIIRTPAVISGIGDQYDEAKVVSGSSGELMRISERGGVGIGRQSWRQLR